MSDQVYEDYNDRLMRDATAPALTTPEENIFLRGYEDFKRQSQGFYDESMRRIDQINEILQPPEKKSPEVSFLPIGAASQTPTSGAMSLVPSPTIHFSESHTGVKTGVRESNNS